MQRFNDLIDEVASEDETTVAMKLLHSGPEGQLNVVSGVVCLVDDDDLVRGTRGQRDRGSKLTYTIAYRIKETTFVRSIDNNVRGCLLYTSPSPRDS